MAKSDAEIRVGLVDDVTANLGKIQKGFTELGEKLSGKSLAGASLDSLKARLEAVKKELSKLDPRSARFGELAKESARVQGAIDGLNAKVKAYGKSAKDAGTDTGGLSLSLTGLNQGLELAKKGLGAVKAVGSVFGDALVGAGDFQDALAALQAVTGAGAEEFDKLKAAAVDASERTKFSSIEAAQGLTELARAGLSATDAIATLNPVLALAQGQQLDVARASEITTITLTQFGLAASEAGRVADVLASAADKSQTDVEKLGLSLSYSAPLARQLGLSLEETVGIIGKLADESFRGEKGGTALRNLFSAISDPASKFSKALDDAGVKTRDFNQIIDFLGTGTDGAKRALIAIDAEARPAILALASKGSEGIKSLTEALQGAEGSAQRTSDILGATFNNTLKVLKNTFENTRNALLEPILAPVSEEFKILSERLSAFAKTDDFKVIVEGFSGVAADGARYIGDLVAAFNFDDAKSAVLRFVDESKAAYADLQVAVQALVQFLRDSRDVIVSAYEYYTDLKNGLREYADASGYAGKATANLADSLDRLREKTGKSTEGIAAAKRAAAELANANKDAGDASKFAGLNAEQFARKLDELAKYGVTASNSVGKFTLDLNDLAPAAGGAGASLGAVTAASDGSSKSLSQLETELKRVREELYKVPEGSPAFTKLAEQAGDLEKKIKDVKDRIDEVSNSNVRVTNSSNNAANAAQNQSAATQQAADSADNLTESTDNLTESTHQGAQATRGWALEFGTLSDAFKEAAINASLTSTSYLEFANRINAFIEQGNLQEEAIKRAIDVIDRQNSALSEEDRIRRQLIAQYGNSSTLIEELVQKKLRLLEVNRQNNAESEREIELEKEKAAGIAGGLGTNPRAAPDAASTGGRQSAGTSARGEAAPISITINQNGATPETIRELTPLIERELSRLGALRR